MRAAGWTESTMHGIAAIGGTAIIADLPAYLYPLRLEHGIYGRIAGGEIAAVPAPACAGHDRSFVTGESD